MRHLRSPTELTTRIINDAIGGFSLVRLDTSGNNLTNKTLVFSTDKYLHFTQNTNNSIVSHDFYSNLSIRKKKHPTKIKLQKNKLSDMPNTLSHIQSYLAMWGVSNFH